MKAKTRVLRRGLWITAINEKLVSMELSGRLELREETLTLCRLLAGAGLARGSHGNMSCYSPEIGLVCIKASGAICTAVTLDDLVLLSIDGQLEVGSRRPSVDTKHHLVVYKQASTVRAIVHTHSPYASAFAALGEPIPALITAVADRFGTKIPCLPYQGPAANVGGLLGVAAREHPGCLIARHGVFAFGSTSVAAFDSAYAIEECAKTCYLARMLGLREPLSETAVGEWNARYRTRYGQQ